MNTKRLVLRITAYSLVVIAFLITVGFASHHQSLMPCTGLFITIDDSTGKGFVEEKDVREIIMNKTGILEGKSLASINISMLEKIINSNPFIYDAEVFSTVDGKVNIEVKQRIPVLRVINYNNESFYLDHEGGIMPPSEKFTARVPVATGYIYDTETKAKINQDKSKIENDSINHSVLQQLYNIVIFTGKKDFWNAMVQQLYVNENGDIEMIPRIGSHTVVIGDDRFLEDKFKKLLVFYREGLNKKGWDKYSMINLKYKDQVVCTKK